MSLPSENRTTDTIELSHVSFTYRTGEPVLTDCSLTIHRGEFLILTGGSGSGKTTVTRLINGLGVQYYEGTQSGSVSVFGMNPADQEISETAQVVGSVFQNPRTQFFNVNTTSELIFACENQGMEREEIFRRLEIVTCQYGLQALLDRSLFELSGGEQQRIACAGVTMARPQVIVLDEPSANLDYQAIGDLHRILAQWRSEGRTIIIAEHRLFYLRDLADRMIVMEEGRITGSYDRKSLLQLSNAAAAAMGLRPLHIARWFKAETGSTEKRNLNDSSCGSGEKRGSKPGAKMEPGIPRQEAELIPAAFEYNVRRQPCRESAATSIVAAPDRVIRIDNLHFHYRDGRHGIDIGHLDLPAGRIVAITGHNGAGKSTLVRCLCGLEKKCRAEIREVDLAAFPSGNRAESGTDTGMTRSATRPLTWRERVRRSYLVMQDVNLQLFSDSVEGEIRISRDYQDDKRRREAYGADAFAGITDHVTDRNKSDVQETDLPAADADLLKRLDLYELRDRHPLSLSGGQRQRTAIAGALAAGKEWLFFDEPTSGLDLRHMKEFAELLRQLRHQGRSIFVITHDPELILSCADCCLTLSDGSVQDLYPLDAAGVNRIRDYFMTAYLGQDRSERD